MRLTTPQVTALVIATRVRGNPDLHSFPARLAAACAIGLFRDEVLDKNRRALTIFGCLRIYVLTQISKALLLRVLAQFAELQLASLDGAVLTLAYSATIMRKPVLISFEKPLKKPTFCVA